MSYATALAARGKAPAWLLELPDHSKRWVSRQCSALTSAATIGLEVKDHLAAELDLNTGELDFDNVTVRILDPTGALGAFLSSADSTLRLTEAILKRGWADEAESGWQSETLMVLGWKLGREGFEIELGSSLRALDSGLYADIPEDTYGLRASIQTSEMFVDVKGDLTEWRAAGFALLWDSFASESELVEYSARTLMAQDWTRLTITTRQALGVGILGKTWGVETQIRAVWALRCGPADLLLRWATTTEAGGNGPDDAADGDGLGSEIPDTALDRTGLLAAQARACGDLEGLWIGPGPVDSVLKYIESEFLAIGLYLALDASGRLTARPLGELQTAATATVGAEFIAEEIPTQERSWDSAENSVRVSWDYHPGTGDYKHRNTLEDTTSRDRYGPSERRELESRGARGLAGAGYGYPNLGWDPIMAAAGSLYRQEFANPTNAVDLQANLDLQDVPVGSLVVVNHGGLFDLTTGAMGVEGALYYLTALERRPLQGRVRLQLRPRRYIGRPWYIAPNAIDGNDYNAATAADRQFGHICPASGTFADGTPAYDTGV